MKGFEELRRAVKTVLRRRAIVLTAVPVLAIGAAGFTMMYSIVAERLLRPLRYDGAERMVAAFQVLPDLRNRAGMQRLWNSFGMSYETFRTLQTAARSFENVAALTTSSRVLSGDGPAERIEVLRVSASLTTLLGVRPATGRLFATGEDQVPGTPVALISFESWQSRFGGRSDILGQRLRLDDVLHEIVGVLPEGFTLPRAVTPGVWIPLGSDADDLRPRSSALSLVGRLREGATTDQAMRELSNVLQASAPSERIEGRVAYWQDELTRNVRRPLTFFLLCASVLLLLAIVSVAGLLAIDLNVRSNEFATRTAIGATRLRLLSQLTAEALVLGALATSLGLWITSAGLPILQSAATSAMPFIRGGRLDIGTIGVTAALIATLSVVVTLVVATLVLGRSPALQVARQLHRTTRHGSRVTSLTIVATQFSLSTLLLIGGGLLALNVFRVSRVDPGFNPAGLHVVNVDIGRDSRDPATAIPIFDAMGERLRAMPGVSRVDIASAMPFSGGNSSGELVVRRAVSHDTVNVRFSQVMPGYLDGLGLRLIAGRGIDAGDRRGSPMVGVVNETMAREFWPGTSPLGMVVDVGNASFTVVGVVSDVRHTSLADPTLPTLYRAEAQSHSRFLQLLVTCGNGAPCEGRDLRAVRTAVADVAPRAVVIGVDAMVDLVARSFAPDRFRAGLTLLFAGLASLLTIIGIHGTTVRTVQRARHDIAVRMALGSSPSRLVRRFVSSFTAVATLGAVSGTMIAALASDTVGPYLTLVSARDPLVYGMIPILTVLLAAAAAWMGARRVAAVDPAHVLKD